MAEYIMQIEMGNAPITIQELIRCRDCKWYDLTHPYGTIIPDAYRCKVNDRFYSAEHFCAYGERSEDESQN